MDVHSPLEKQTETYVSTGHLPSPQQALVTAAYQRFQSDTDGEVSQVHPALARMPSDLIGICVVGTDGDTLDIADATHEFAIMSVSKRSCSH